MLKAEQIVYKLRENKINARYVNENLVQVLADGYVYDIIKTDDFGWQRWVTFVCYIDKILRQIQSELKKRDK